MDKGKFYLVYPYVDSATAHLSDVSSADISLVHWRGSDEELAKSLFGCTTTIKRLIRKYSHRRTWITVYRWVRAGKFPAAVKIDGTWFVRDTSLGDSVKFDFNSPPMAATELPYEAWLQIGAALNQSADGHDEG